MQHLIREDSRGMLSFREAIWLQEITARERPPIRERVAAVLVALATRLAPPATVDECAEGAVARAA